jgi:Putative Flp pilus-assembly TadE/G-like
LKILVRKRQNEAGQAVLLVVLGMSFFLIGAAGLALDGSHLYAQRQMAQAAADAAAQAGMLSVFDGSYNAGGNANGFAAGSFTCATGDARTPCYYAQTMNGFNATTDVVTFTTSPAGVAVPNLSASDPVNLLQVTVQRQVNTTLMSLLGPTASTIGVSSTAAIVSLNSPVPLMVLDPSASGALSSSGSPTLTVCGGPSRGIQVNSVSAAAVSLSNSTTIDLSNGACVSGSGTDFGVFGGPGSPGFTFTAGATSHYVQPASPVIDPLAGVSAPPVPIAAAAPTTLGAGVKGCPPSPTYPCWLYSPGLYTGGIDAKNQTAVFQPGIYYIQGGSFGSSAASAMVMATGVPPDGATNTGWTRNMLVYNTGVFSVGANGVSTADLVGSPAASAYEGILFFENGASQTHSIGGGGGSLSLTGTIYLPNQGLNLQGVVTIRGELITGVLNLGGSSGITVNLPASTYPARQVALVQ